MGLLVFFIYQTFVKDKLIDHLPLPFNQRLSLFKGVDEKYTFPYLLVIFVSLLIGGTSHILWDGFTHANGDFVKSIPALSGVIQFDHHQIPVYNVIQHVSTAFGAIMILFHFFSLPKGLKTQSHNLFGYWIEVVLLTVVISFIRLASVQSKPEIGDIIVTLISAGLIGLMTVSILGSLKNNMVD